MSKYIIMDWAGNVMNWGEFDSFEDANIEIDARVNEELSEMGLNLALINSSGLGDEYVALENALDKIIAEFHSEYHIEELFTE